MNTKQEVITYINTLKGYEGYVQFSHRPIDTQKDIFYEGKNVEVNDEDGFVYEAHFCNGEESVAIRQFNDRWQLSKTDISAIYSEDIQKYVSDVEHFNYKVKMAQVWESHGDKNCEEMKVKKLKKVVFAGFEKGGEV